MKHTFFAGIALLYCVIFTSCAQERDQVVTFHTRYGDMVAILYDETPKHKQNFIKLAKEHYFDSLMFHRVIDGFMIQGGDPDSRKAAKGAMLGQGGPGYTIDAEFNPKYYHEKGALSAARLGDQMNPSKASSGSQFYIVHGTKVKEEEIKIDPAKFNQAMQQFFQNPANKAVYDSIGQFYQANDLRGAQEFILKLKPRVEKETGIATEKDVPAEQVKAYTTVGGAPQLDGAYTVFGKVIKGLDIIDTIAKQSVDQAKRPLEDIRMTVTVEEVSKKKIEKLYGYHYPPSAKK
ncbi:peptidylprolyl isomerase [Parachryseolinea silvisoli]|jgi:peptidyl-prolyl cis-trans isomerase B (cyclophilin B)|uniref:peptidylprolyl isomerase n=1 Tax=Parachryseolinea silvisoli TaxID=2873601 RepID=UPI002265F895|nr:peptidylprolyl isomerase [Parachryseolinea silvisoli]MCD9014264.1 peptidylprolyl isomerase [Parachryseolinea silvisoli]